MNFKSLTDESLIEYLRDNRQGKKAFAEIYERYWQKLVSLATFKLNSSEIAVEIVQEIFIKIWENRNQSTILHVESYLFSALKYQIISYLRTVVSSRKMTNNYSESLVHSQETLTADALKTAIEKAITHLPDKTQQVFKLSRFEEKTHKEISSELDISEKSVEYHITQSLKLLREHLKDFMILVLALQSI